MHAHTRSTQQVLALNDGEILCLDLPGPACRVGKSCLRWGRAGEPLTPAYWAAQAWMWTNEAPDHFRLGDSLAEEMLACILGGYGIPAEVGLAAFQRLRAVHLADPEKLCDAKAVERLLEWPLEINGKQVRYRFPKQKSRYVAAAFCALEDLDERLSDRPLRDCINQIAGFGPKTASWVVRNWRASEEVAILDVHIMRAGSTLGIFDRSWRVERDYARIEDAYLSFARDLHVRPSILDSVMWMTMRQLQSQAPRPRLTS